MAKKIRAIVTTGNGTNCEMEMAHACRLSGFDQVDIVHISELLCGTKRLDDYDFLNLPGGFLDGDDLGSAKAGANRILHARVAGTDERLFAQFTRFIGQSGVYFPLLWKTVLSVRGEVGYIMRDGKEIPIDEKFYLGGINTIRGYSSRTVSPIENGVYVGGVKEAFFNVDYVFPIVKDFGLKGVAFFDAGNSYAEGQQIFSKLLMSYGLGIRWYSPMGPLRLEYGFPVNPREGIDSKGGKFEFSIGGFF